MKNNPEEGAHLVHILGDERGYRPRGSAHQGHCEAAVKAGYVTPKNRAWGHRVTDAGTVVLAKLAAEQEAKEHELREAGFDPKKPIADMTEAEIEAYLTWKKAQK